jgi:hypothetical protein
MRRGCIFLKEGGSEERRRVEGVDNPKYGYRGQEVCE